MNSQRKNSINSKIPIKSNNNRTRAEIPFIDLDDVEVPPPPPRPVPYETTPTEFFKAQYNIPDTDEPLYGESPIGLRTPQGQRDMNMYVGKTKVGAEPVLIDDELLPGPQFDEGMKDIIFDDDFSILVDSVIEGREPPNSIGYKNADGVVFSLFEIFERIVEEEEAKVKECIETDNFDYENVALNRDNLEVDATFVDIKAALRSVPNVFLLKAIDKLLKAEIKNRIYHTIHKTDRSKENAHKELLREAKKSGFIHNNGGSIEILSYLGTTGKAKPTKGHNSGHMHYDTVFDLMNFEQSLQKATPTSMDPSSPDSPPLATGGGGLQRNKFGGRASGMNKVSFSDGSTPGEDFNTTIGIADESSKFNSALDDSLGVPPEDPDNTSTPKTSTENVVQEEPEVTTEAEGTMDESQKEPEAAAEEVATEEEKPVE